MQNAVEQSLLRRLCGLEAAIVDLREKQVKTARELRRAYEWHVVAEGLYLELKEQFEDAQIELAFSKPVYAFREDMIEEI